jgi:hypothetical protein
MNPANAPPAPTDVLFELTTFLHETGSALSAPQAVALAIRAWLAASGDGVDRTANFHSNAPAAYPVPYSATHFAKRSGAHPTARGYQWKCLFLPDGTDLRMNHDGRTWHAHVIGDAIIHEGRRVSPHQFALAVAGDGRNAWRDVSLRLPGQPHWQRARLLRRQLQAHAQAPPTTPADAMATASSAMSEALRSALALVEHCRPHAPEAPERRGKAHRRASDVLSDVCAYD